jgi:hypothetical protein
MSEPIADEKTGSPVEKSASPVSDSPHDARRPSLANVEKGTWERLWPVIACGAGLFSDGYLNGVSRRVSFPVPGCGGALWGGHAAAVRARRMS